MAANMRAICAALLTEGKAQEMAAQKRYESADLVDAYWAMVDLTSSTAFRLSAGENKAFVRIAVYTSLFEMICGEYSEIQIIKGLGDGFLLRSQSFRSILQLLALIDGVAQYWDADVRNSEGYPSLAARAAISHGPAFEESGDYYGAPIDRVARISGMKPVSDNCLAVVDDSVRRNNQERIEAELPFLKFGAAFPLNPELLKAGEHPVRVSQIHIDRREFGGFDKYFLPMQDWYARLQGNNGLPSAVG